LFAGMTHLPKAEAIFVFFASSPERLAFLCELFDAI